MTTAFLENAAMVAAVLGSIVTLVGSVVFATASQFNQPKVMKLTFPNGLPTLPETAPVDPAGGGSQSAKPLDRVAFEAEALSNYYNHALRRANVSFAFSLVFAAIGFVVIVYAIGSYDPSDRAGAIIRVLSGVVIDAVAALFFAQSNKAQASMQSFFEKLRVDRASVQAMTLLAEVEDPVRRDELRAQFILKLAEIDRLVTGGAG